MTGEQIGQAIAGAALLIASAVELRSAARHGRIAYGHVFSKPLIVDREASPRAYKAAVAALLFVGLAGLATLVRAL